MTRPTVQIVETSGPDHITLHASAVAYRDCGVMITGAPGSGKSTLASELIAMGAGLVADDWITLERGRAGGLIMSPPPPIAGLMELRGLGLVRLPHTDQAPLSLICDLDRAERERIPERASRTLLGRPCPVIFGRDRPGLAAALMAVMIAGGLLDPDHFAGAP